MTHQTSSCGRQGGNWLGGNDNAVCSMRCVLYIHTWPMPSLLFIPRSSCFLTSWCFCPRFLREKWRLLDVDYLNNFNCDLQLGYECRCLFLVISITLWILWVFDSEDFLLKSLLGGLEMAAYPPWAAHGSLLSWVTAFSLSKVPLHPTDREHSKN